MKKYIMTLGAMAFAAASFSQSAYDALNYNQLDPVMGTARYSAMAGAFGALGGNPSVTKDNPAGIGVYKRCDLTFSPNVYVDNTKDAHACLNNFAFVINFREHEAESGYITSSLGISYNRLRNFNRYSSTKSYDYSGLSLTDYMCKEAAPDYIFNEANEMGLISDEGSSEFYSRFDRRDNFDKQTRYTESGHVGQWDISYGMNISNRVYLGAALGISVLDYKQKALYDESSVNSQIGSYYLDNYYDVDGVGVNFKLGAIVKPVDFMRIGLAIHTRTLYDIFETYSVDFDYNDQYSNQPEVDHGECSYKLKTPFKMQGSLGFVIANKALIGLEYNLDNYSAMRMSDYDGDLVAQNDQMKEEFNAVHTFKLGAEYKVIDEFSLRAGFAFMTSPIDYDKNLGEELYLFRPLSLPQQTHYITGGAGYEGDKFYCDLAYVFRNQKANFYGMLPQDETASSLNLKNHNIIATIGWRF
ncbi:MAG: outer membrane protein transport protein [Paludibacteraceae bacterium]|nr:outer membrane protein transport protein [Paludibacteraceae bacterium]